MFGFGKALDVLRDGDPVRRGSWQAGMWLRLGLGPSLNEIVPEHGRGQMYKGHHFDLVNGDFFGCWSPTHEDLLAEDWDHANG